MSILREDRHWLSGREREKESRVVSVAIKNGADELSENTVLRDTVDLHLERDKVEIETLLDG